jgi:hypothetical protein
MIAEGLTSPPWNDPVTAQKIPKSITCNPKKILRQTIESSPITKKWKKFGALILTGKVRREQKQKKNICLENHNSK